MTDLLRFNNFAQTTGFYWSYMVLLKHPFFCQTNKTESHEKDTYEIVNWLMSPTSVAMATTPANALINGVLKSTKSLILTVMV